MSREDVRRWIVAYDISSDARRARVADALLAFGDRVQYSVFVVDASPASKVRMERRLKGLIDMKADSVLICDLGPARTAAADRFTWVGLDRPITGSGSFVV